MEFLLEYHRIRKYHMNFYYRCHTIKSFSFVTDSYRMLILSYLCAIMLILFVVHNVS